MLLRNSISSTENFFQKTINNLKSFLSIGSTYQRLPKTPFHLFSCGRDAKDQVANDAGYTNDLDNFYNEFTNQWDSYKKKVKNKAKKKNQNGNCDYSAKAEENGIHSENNYDLESKGSNSSKENSAENGDILKDKKIKIISRIVRKPELCSRSVREKRFYFVVEKLKKLKEIDEGNKVDYEEFLHYYSRRTCPAYLDIVDKFLMEMCTEFFNSRPKIRFRSQSQNRFHG